MNETYTKGRWTASIAPSTPPRYSLAPAGGDDEHIATVTYTGEGTLPNPQRMTGWAPESMFESLRAYVDERDAADHALGDEPGSEEPSSGEQDLARPDACNGCTYHSDYNVRVFSSRAGA